MRVMVIVRPYGHLGGDTLIAKEFAQALEALGADVEIRPADNIDDAGLFDWCHMYAACAPEWGLSAAAKLNTYGARWTVTPLYYPRDARLLAYNGTVGDLYLGYKEGIAAILEMSTAIAATTMGELRECWRMTGDNGDLVIGPDNFQIKIDGSRRKMVPEKAGFVMGRGFTPLRQYDTSPRDYAITIGRIEPHKNQVQTAIACAMSGLKYVCVGTIANEQYAEHLKQAGAQVLGELPHDDTMQLLAGAKVHVLASFGEIVSGANCEAAYLGVPMVIGLGHDWEYFQDRAEYCDPADWRTINRAITRAISRPRIPWTNQPTWKSIAMRWLEWTAQQQ